MPGAVAGAVPALSELTQWSPGGGEGGGARE